MQLNIKNAINEPGREFKANCVITVEDEGIAFDKPVELELRYMFSGDKLKVWGSASGAVVTTCDRCLAETSLPINAVFEEYFVKEVTEENEYTIEGDEIDLSRFTADFVSLNLPAKILCNDDCKGLCPRCGADLNTETCSCVITNAGPFGVLAGMFNDNEEVE